MWYTGSTRKPAHVKRRYEMNDVAKGMLLVLMLLYIISPVDLMPGPVDDVIVALMGVAMMSRKSEE